MPGAAVKRGAAPAREQVGLAQFTTLGLGGPARRFVETGAEDDLIAQVSAADERGEPLLVLGGGSNLVIADDGFPGTVVRVATTGIRQRPLAGTGAVAVTVAAGEDWDTVVAWSVAERLAGLECLSGIPGLAGATPIQNVGAYGQDVAATVTSVRAYDRVRRMVTELSGDECGFGYRDSVFKRTAAAAGGLVSPGHAPGPRSGHATGAFVILDVTYRLTRSDMSQPVRYRELAASLGVPEGGTAPLAEVRTAVLGLRRAKGMVLDPADPDTRSAGSFFTNPVLDRQQFTALKRRVADTCGGGVRVPWFPAEGGGVKIPAAWLIERAGFAKGYAAAGREAGTEARISAKHSLALVNPGGATTVSLLGLAAEIRDGVRAAFGVNLACEPVLVGAGL